MKKINCTIAIAPQNVPATILSVPPIQKFQADKAALIPNANR